MTLEDLALQGHSSVRTSMVSGLGAKLMEIRKDFIRESFSDLNKTEHRLEFVSKVHGIEFINDSLATNVNATWYALETMVKPVIWIAGGLDGGKDYSSLRNLVKEKVVSIICLGTDNRNLIFHFQDLNLPMFIATSMEDAVNLAYTTGKKGDVVLLSPATASFDLFKDYEQRGKAFKNAVKQL